VEGHLRAVEEGVVHRPVGVGVEEDHYQVGEGAEEDHHQVGEGAEEDRHQVEEGAEGGLRQAWERVEEVGGHQAWEVAVGAPRHLALVVAEEEGVVQS